MYLTMTTWSPWVPKRRHDTIGKDSEHGEDEGSMEVLESGQERTERFNVDNTMKKTVGHRSHRMDTGEEVVRSRIHGKLSLSTGPGVASASPARAAASASATDGSDQKQAHIEFRSQGRNVQ